MQADLCSNGFEAAFLAVTAISLLSVLISGFLVYDHIEAPENRLPDFLAIFISVFEIFAPSSSLCSRGKKWQRVLYLSVVISIMLFYLASNYGICS